MLKHINIHHGFGSDTRGGLGIVITTKVDTLSSPVVQQKIAELAAAITRFVKLDPKVETESAVSYGGRYDVKNGTVNQGILAFDNVTRNVLNTLFELLDCGNYRDFSKKSDLECVKILDEMIRKILALALRQENSPAAFATLFAWHPRCGAGSELNSLPIEAGRLIAEHLIGTPIAPGKFFVKSATITLHVGVYEAKPDKFNGGINMSISPLQFCDIPITIFPTINNLIERFGRYIVQDGGSVSRDVPPISKKSDPNSQVVKFKDITPAQKQFLTGLDGKTLEYSSRDPGQFVKAIDELSKKIYQDMGNPFGGFPMKS